MNRIAGLAFFIVISSLLTLLPRVSASTRIDLNRDWQFCADPHDTGATAGWPNHPPAATESANVPHTWNLGKDANYLGKAWYFHTFQLPGVGPAVRAELHLGATFYSSRVWLNGVQVGSHQGGYTAYSIDLTDQLQATNYLAIEIDNRITEETIPGFAMRQMTPRDAWFDWWDYGGIVRDVWLTLSDSVEIQRQRIRSEVRNGSAIVHDQIFWASSLKGSPAVSLRVAAHDANNQVAGSAGQLLKLDQPNGEVEVSFSIPKPQLWGIDHPHLYRISAEVLDENGKVLDEQSDTFGLRTIEIRDRHLLINGERVRLTGMTRHADSPWEGLAETRGTMLHDYDDMRSLQATLTRPAHYFQNPFVFDYADRHGILLIPEIPVWQFSESQLSDPHVIATAQQQIKEMIEQAGNHPSIFAWSVCNESDTGTPGGIAYFRAMRDFIRQLDPERFVSFADDNLPKLRRAEDSAANDADFLMMNEYFGSWHGPEEALPAALDHVDHLFPHKMAIVSEFGLPGIFSKDPEEADRKRIRIIRDQMPEMARRDWIAGTIFWCYQDYKSRRNLRFGEDGGYVDHGLVDQHRQPRPSYDVWKELNAPASVEVSWDHEQSEPSVFRATVKPNSLDELPSYPLRGYRLTWEIYDGKTKLAQGEHDFADLNGGQTVTDQIPGAGRARQLQLHLVLERPTGEIAAEKTVDWNASQQTDGNRGAQSPEKSHESSERNHHDAP